MATASNNTTFQDPMWGDGIDAHERAKNFELSPWFFQRQKVGRVAGAVLLGFGAVAATAAIGASSVLVGSALPIVIAVSAVAAVILTTAAFTLFFKSYYSDPAYLQTRRNKILDCLEDNGLIDMQRRFGNEVRAYPSLLNTDDTRSVLKRDYIKQGSAEFTRRNGATDILTQDHKKAIVFNQMKIKGYKHCISMFSDILNSLNEEQKLLFKNYLIYAFNTLSATAYVEKHTFPEAWKDEFRAFINIENFTTLKGFNDKFEPCLKHLYTLEQIIGFNEHFLENRTFDGLMKDPSTLFMDKFKKGLLKRNTYIAKAYEATQKLRPETIVREYGVDVITSDLITADNRSNHSNFATFQDLLDAYGRNWNTVVIMYQKSFYTQEYLAGLIQGHFNNQAGLSGFRKRYPSAIETGIVPLSHSMLKPALLNEVLRTGFTTFLDNPVDGHEEVVKDSTYAVLWNTCKESYDQAVEAKNQALSIIEEGLTKERETAMATKDAQMLQVKPLKERISSIETQIRNERIKITALCERIQQGEDPARLRAEIAASESLIEEHKKKLEPLKSTLEEFIIRAEGERMRKVVAADFVASQKRSLIYQSFFENKTAIDKNFKVFSKS